MKKNKQEEIKTYQSEEWNPMLQNIEITTYYELRAQDKLKGIVRDSISKKLLETYDQVIERMAQDILSQYDIRWALANLTGGSKGVYRLVGSCRYKKKENGENEN
jgi:hypothetical protein